MLRFFTFLAILYIGFLATSPSRAAAPDWQALDKLIDAFQKPDAPGISLAVSINGQTVYHRWVGQADLAHDVSIDADTRFNIASVSKQFTAFAIMLLADEGKLTLDQDVRKIIPELEVRPTPVTIRNLLNHTSGLREANSLLQLIGMSESSPLVEARALDLVLRQRGGNFPAGQRQEYSNTGYQLLAEVVARVSGQTFADFMRSRIFEPLGMERTFVHTDPEQIIADLAVGYQPVGDGFEHAHLLSATYGSTGIVSDPRDLLRWARALEKSEIGGRAVMDAMAARATLPDGRRAIATNGQEQRKFRGLDTWSHGGSTGGFRSFLLRIPGKRVAIAVMSNRSDFLKAAFAFDVAEALLADNLEPEPATDFLPETGTDLDPYVGDYRLFAGIVFSLRRDGDHLIFSTFGKDDASRLPQIEKGVFMLNPVNQLRLEFHDFADGHATEMRWQVSEDGFIPAPRVIMQPDPEMPLNIEELEGSYYCDTLQQVITLFEDGGALWLRTGYGNRVLLDRYQPDTFRPDGQARIQRVEILRGTGARVVGVFVSAALADNIEYRKLDEDKITGQ